MKEKKSLPLSELKNLGPTILKRLKEIRIQSEIDLRKMGAVKAYILMQKKSKTKLPVCYYLYSLVGALEGKHWNEISATKKKELLGQIGRSHSK